jgi:hypothetical protein
MSNRYHVHKLTYLPRKKQWLVDASKVVLDITKESADAFPALKSCLGGINTPIKHYELLFRQIVSQSRDIFTVGEGPPKGDTGYGCPSSGGNPGIVWIGAPISRQFSIIGGRPLIVNF